MLPSRQLNVTSTATGSPPTSMGSIFCTGMGTPEIDRLTQTGAVKMLGIDREPRKAVWGVYGIRLPPGMHFCYWIAGGSMREKFCLLGIADVAGKFPDHVARSLDQIIALHCKSLRSLRSVYLSLRRYPHGHLSDFGSKRCEPYRGQRGNLRGLPPSSPLRRAAFVLAFDVTWPPRFPSRLAACEIASTQRMLNPSD